jgi:hypothetical protein
MQKWLPGQTIRTMDDFEKNGSLSHGQRFIAAPSFVDARQSDFP